MTGISSRTVAAVFALGMLNFAQAAEEGDWIVRVGMHDIDPDSSGGAGVRADAATQVTFDFTYLFSDKLGIEVLAALPFEHDLYLVSGPRIGSTEHLPPTVSVQYRFGENRVQPYIGAGVNYTVFSSEKTTGLLAGTSLDLDASTGLALQVGVDIEFGNRRIFNAVLRSIDIETDASLDGSPIGTVKIDPLAIGLNFGWIF